ncbi:hypothetical protein [Actinomadura sp. 7K507]|uniref:hypothetical protein n=1 Tax=Actinomadura sp. 7K507 TaxID=2530365 RepID=UPI00104D71DD|nr:hypothetical protein [Actinomadura sp. 7K507]TDC78665.1 hypothetical protein E1285_37130 [Actinomadura sp. 7K507]
MSARVLRTAIGTLTVGALLVAALGFVVQMIAGVTDTPTIPPGLVAILLAAGLIAFVPGRAVPLAAPAAGLLNLIVFAFKAADRLVEPNPASGLIGAWAMALALIVATVGGTIATLRNYRTRSMADA